jgi:CDGSH-type Zn-finger protein
MNTSPGKESAVAGIEIRIMENGPYKVYGPMTLLDHEGNQVEVREGKAVALCRCGASTKKPFCDGTHSRIGFIAAEAAVEAEKDVR